MNANYTVSIKSASGYSNSNVITPRCILIRTEPVKKYMLCHIRIKHDFCNTRLVNIYYGTNVESFFQYIANNCIFNEEDRLMFLEKKQFIRNGNTKCELNQFNYFEVDDVDTETPKKALLRIQPKTRAFKERNFLLTEEQIFQFNDMDKPLPECFKVGPNTTLKQMMRILYPPSRITKSSRTRI